MIYRELLQHLVENERLEKMGFISFGKSVFDGKYKVHLSRGGNSVEYMLNMTNQKLIIEKKLLEELYITLELKDFDIFTLEEPQYVDEMLAEQPDRFIDKRRPTVTLGEIKNG